MNANAPLSEQFLSAASDQWTCDPAVSMLEETKSAVLFAAHGCASGIWPLAKRSFAVGATPEWAEHVASIVNP